MKERKIYLDFLRIIACFAVMFYHVQMLYYGRLESLNALWNLFFFSFTRFAVPVFFMISGAIFYERHLSIKQAVLRAFRTLLILLVFSIFYYINKNNDINLAGFVRAFYADCQSINGAFWFLYIYIAFLVMQPFVRNIAINLTKDSFEFLIILMIACQGVIPVFEFFASSGELGVTGNITMLGYSGMAWITYNGVFYPLVGYYLDSRIDSKQLRKYIIPSWIIAVIGISLTVLLTWCKIHVLGIDDNNPQTFGWNYTYFTAIAVFISTKYVISRRLWEDRFKYIIVRVGKTTFGIYLIHNYIIGKQWANRSAYTVAKSLIFATIVFIECSIIVLFYQNIVKYAKTIIMKCKAQ